MILVILVMRAPAGAIAPDGEGAFTVAKAGRLDNLVGGGTDDM